MKFLFVLAIILFLLPEIPAQTRYTKGAENGSAWLALEEPGLPDNNNKYNYLSNILEREKLLKNKFTKYDYLFCDNEINLLLKEGNSKNYSMEDVIEQIDQFYSVQENLKIPIVFAYCYIIKKEAALTEEELKAYKKSVLMFCNE